ncbi:DUF2254 domain-containing protein [Streptomyces sp. NPDC008313]|uniref:DUF2254 domain-containing protein n=1 Tax=Streptomyces sp. NPDC008313 TaxID=3364826 RepID=UPI0036F10441
MGDWVVTERAGSGRRSRGLSPWREHLRDTFWFAPTAAMVLVFVVWALASEADALIVESLRDAHEYDVLDDLVGFAADAKTVVTVVSSAMMTFIGVVFSISLVALQMAGGQFSPRVVRMFVRSRIGKATFAVFLATFLLSLLVLTAFEGEREPRRVTAVPLVQSVLTLVMVGLSLLLFVMYVNSMLRLMRVSHVIDRIASESSRVLVNLPSVNLPSEAAAADLTPVEEAFGPQTARVAHRGRAGVLRDVRVRRLVRVARRQGVVLRLIPRIGDFIVPGTPLFAVHGGAAPSPRALSSVVSVGVERAFHQDVGFGLRQLADIGLRALSAAVNDPTTAVQAVDRVVQLLAALSRRSLGPVLHRDRDGAVRLVRAVPDWTELVDLGFAEIRGCAVGTPQVTRRLLAGFDDLLLLAPEGRREPLLRHRDLLARAVERSVPEPADRAFALQPDRQGIC